METIAKYEVEEITWPEKTFITIRATKAFDKLPSFFGESYAAIYSALQKLGLQTNEPPCAIYYTIDEEKKETELATAVPVNAPVPEIKEFEKVVIPASKVITTTHHGSYESMGPAYEQLEKYLAGHKLTRKLIIEQYFSDPAVEKDPANWKTRIFFVVN